MPRRYVGAPRPSHRASVGAILTERESKFLVKLQRVYARMTWLGEAKKDGVSTDMFRGVANRL